MRHRLFSTLRVRCGRGVTQSPGPRRPPGTPPCSSGSSEEQSRFELDPHGVSLDSTQKSGVPGVASLPERVACQEKGILRPLRMAPGWSIQPGTQYRHVFEHSSSPRMRFRRGAWSRSRSVPNGNDLPIWAAGAASVFSSYSALAEVYSANSVWGNTGLAQSLLFERRSH